MSTTPSPTPSRPDPGVLTRQAIEGQIGMLTCQVLELQIQLQHAYGEISRLNAELVEANTFRAQVEAADEAEAETPHGEPEGGD